MVDQNLYTAQQAVSGFENVGPSLHEQASNIAETQRKCEQGDYMAGIG